MLGSRGARHHVITHKVLHSEDEDVALRREAAYNLALVYKHSGNELKARQVLRDFVTVF